MEVASSILSSILSKIREYFVESIHQANYLLRFKNIVDDLKKEDENLRSTQHRVQHEVERAKRNSEEIEKDVEKWLMDVQNVLEEIQRLEDDIQVKKTFLCGRCPNLRWRYKLSKRAVKKTSVMLKLQDSGKFDRVSHSTTLPGVEVSDVFFEEMKTLKVASLNWVHLSLNSLQFLTNLVTLQLIDCKLRDISSLKKLAKLEILRLKSSGLVELPEELGELSKLRMLDITDCWKLKRIPANVIPRLSQLEELYSFKAWEVEGTSAERSNASLSELYQLNHLTILSLNINVQPCLSKDFVLPTNLLRYEISVNNDGVWASYPKSRILKIRGIEATSLVAFKSLCEKVEYLELYLLAMINVWDGLVFEFDVV
ncbi:hypothetical protein EZV62_008192 [Acer yangbiense]|uniref:Rx N-terminal domain-containing protein n=1 Tax=Acer yangbiense TaxID=1000413 RepID=A0A5C7ICH2_9ROSI|nr:hypothetical protein EZV62_008192 [Acer yangbiense]